MQKLPSSVTEEIIENSTVRSLYISHGHKVADLNYDKEISFDEEDYTVYFIDDNKGLFISAGLNINNSDDNSVRVNVRKRSAGTEQVRCHQESRESFI